MAHSKVLSLIVSVTVGALLFVASSASEANIGLSAEEEQLMDWIAQEGGNFSVALGRNADGLRGVFTTRSARKGEVLIHIPEHLALSVKPLAAAEVAPLLLKELHTPCSRLRPYMDTLPKEGEVLTAYNFPDEYVKYLANEALESHITTAFKRHAHATFEGRNNGKMAITIPEAVGRMNVSLSYWLHVVSLLSSRTFSLRDGVLSMIPLLDMVNHDSRDENYVDAKDGGYRLIAGRDLAAGEEVTISYGSLRSDELLLFYGFLDTVTSPPQLLATDHRNYTGRFFELQPQEEEPTDAEAAAEVERLQRLLGEFDRRLEELGPVPDTDPRVANLVRAYHAQRRLAIESELARLQRGEGQRTEL
ncbi:hypothetical protein Agub_g13239 [Astrephomene gubernaculifera]|uniref:SET domain-containing protein n=1 Tax=Astrephomene gubernaculifera TaxID=47775 RepID=A0AAD3DZG7_9CHLO|nr:hypothetical protein Agub_g13239 [Astrephomene gubernaculifera]